MKMELNINDDVMIRLTEKGKEILEYEGLYTKLVETDEEGYVKFQLHEVMDIFGKYVDSDFDLPFEPNIVIVK